MQAEGPEQDGSRAERGEPLEGEARERTRVGYLGPAGTFSEEALLRSARADGVEPVALASIYDTVMALRGGTVSWAVVPIENSLDGSVTVTLDLLAEEQGDLEIVGEALLAVRHSLIAAEMVALSEIDTIISHPKVPGQCTRLLRGELAHARVEPASSTAEAVRLVVGERRRGRAALGTRLAADIYGGTVVREGVQDRAENVTRFVWLARVERADGEPPPLRARASAVVEGRSTQKTSVVFWGPGADSPGWLVRCLDEFAKREINLTKIESRPRRARLGHYMFFVDLQGSAHEPAVAQALEGLRAICEEVRVLGSYAAGESLT
jgi:prephenate dehydratase